MKINRLLEITIILLNRGSITARELADRFGVSIRTIYRDIEDLSSSGIPVYATQGAGGGIRLLENYSINKTLISDRERESLIFALQQLQVTRYPEVDSILEKLGTIFKTNASELIQVDFSPWGSDPNQFNNLNNIKSAILNSVMVGFDYVTARNERSRRMLEPLRLIYKGNAWYVWGWSVEREDYRTFRISRIRNLRLTDNRFDRGRERIPAKGGQEADSDVDTASETPYVTTTVKFTDKVLSRLYDDYNDDQMLDNHDGTYTVTMTFPLDEWVYGYLLSFGPEAQVLGPDFLREEIAARVRKMLGHYEG